MGRQYFGKLSIPRGRWVYPTPRDRPEHHSALVASAQSMLSTTQPRRSRSPVVLVSLLSLFAVAGCAIRAEPASPKGTPSATETLLAVSAGPQVVAVDSASTYPEKVRCTKLSGLTPDPEAIAAHKPDLVIVASAVNNLSAALATARRHWCCRTRKRSTTPRPVRETRRGDWRRGRRRRPGAPNEGRHRQARQPRPHLPGEIPRLAAEGAHVAGIAGAGGARGAFDPGGSGWPRLAAGARRDRRSADRRQVTGVRTRGIDATTGCGCTLASKEWSVVSYGTEACGTSGRQFRAAR